MQNEVQLTHNMSWMKGTCNEIVMVTFKAMGLHYEIFTIVLYLWVLWGFKKHKSSVFAFVNPADLPILHRSSARQCLTNTLDLFWLFYHIHGLR